MTGTKEGGIKAAATNKAKYGHDFYVRNGRKGGRNGHTGGFATSHEWAVECGRKGGTISRKRPENQKKTLRSRRDSTKVN